jgi:3',5'-cyclic-AMP phosphodiesterase
MCRIIHITDLHLDDSLTQEIALDTRKNFLKVVDKIKTIKPDAIIVGGDLGDKKSLKWLKNTLDKLEVKYFIVLGNHDKISEVEKVFNLKNKIHKNKLCYTVKIKGKNIIILDSSDNSVSSEELDYLTEKSSDIKEDIMLFIHHPPVKCGCRFMDKYFSLNNSNKVMRALIKIKNITNIFCGHYHIGKVIQKNKKNIYLTPSTACQISEKATKLEIASTSPGYRIIEWTDNNKIKSEYFFL